MKISFTVFDKNGVALPEEMDAHEKYNDLLNDTSDNGFARWLFFCLGIYQLYMDDANIPPEMIEGLQKQLRRHINPNIQETQTYAEMTKAQRYQQALKRLLYEIQSYNISSYEGCDSYQELKDFQEFIRGLRRNPSLGGDLLSTDPPYVEIFNILDIQKAVYDRLNTLTLPGIMQGVEIKEVRKRNDLRLQLIEFPDDQVPKDYMCLISHAIMDVPVYLSEEPMHYYDELNLGLYLMNENRSPMTRRVYPSNNPIVKSKELAAKIDLFVDKAVMVATNFPDQKQETYELFMDEIKNKELTREHFIAMIRCHKDYKAVHKIAVNAMKNKSYDSAARVFLTLRWYFNKTKNPEAIATVCYNLSSCWLRMGDYDKAHKYIDECLNFRLEYPRFNFTEESKTKALNKKKSIDNHKKASTLFSEADACMPSDPDKAIDCYERGIRLYPFKDDERMASAESQLEILKSRTKEPQRRPACSAGAV